MPNFTPLSILTLLTSGISTMMSRPNWEEKRGDRGFISSDAMLQPVTAEEEKKKEEEKNDAPLIPIALELRKGRKNAITLAFL